MSLRLTLLRLWFPRKLKLWMLDELTRVTAEGFGSPAPRWPGRSFDDQLAAYADFTAREARKLLAGEDADAIETAKERLRRGAARVGTDARRRLSLRRPDDAFEAWRLLYRQIGIEVGGLDSASPGIEVTVTRCFFAGRYDEPVCESVGALDDGMADGLFGGATLEFFERLTGGGPCCRAILRLRGERP